MKPGTVFCNTVFLLSLNIFPQIICDSPVLPSGVWAALALTINKKAELQYFVMKDCFTLSTWCLTFCKVFPQKQYWRLIALSKALCSCALAGNKSCCYVLVVEMLELMQVVGKDQYFWRTLFNEGDDVILTMGFKDFSYAFVKSGLSKKKTHIQHQLKAPAFRYTSD